MIWDYNFIFMICLTHVMQIPPLAIFFFFLIILNRNLFFYYMKEKQKQAM